MVPDIKKVGEEKHFPCPPSAMHRRMLYISARGVQIDRTKELRDLVLNMWDQHRRMLYISDVGVQIDPLYDAASSYAGQWDQRDEYTSGPLSLFPTFVILTMKI